MSKVHNKDNKPNKPNKFRLAIIEDKTHKHLFNIHFTRTSFLVALISTLVVLIAVIYSLIAFTPIRTFIPGYPDAHSRGPQSRTPCA